MNMDPLVDFRRNPPPEKSLPEPPEVLRAGSTLNTVFVIGGWVGSIAGAYHGYKRNDSVGWAIGWSLLGAFWPVTIPIMVAQGFGKPIAKGATENRRKARKKTSK